MSADHSQPSKRTPHRRIPSRASSLSRSESRQRQARSSRQSAYGNHQSSPQSYSESGASRLRMPTQIDEIRTGRKRTRVNQDSGSMNQGGSIHVGNSETKKLGKKRKNSSSSSLQEYVARQNFSEHVYTKQKKSAFAFTHALPSQKTKSGQNRLTHEETERTHRMSRNSSDKNNKKKRPLLLRKPAIISLLVVVIVCAAAYGIDSILNGDKIYSGVTIGEIDVSNMTKDEAITAVSDHYSSRISENIPVFYASQDDLDADETDTSESIDDQITDEESADTRIRWTVPADSVDATFNIDAIVDEAFSVGRDEGGLIARLQAMISGWNLEPTCTFNEASLESLLDEMTDTVGNKRVDYNIELDDDGIASVTDGNDGNEVTSDWLISRLNATYFGDSESVTYVLETEYMPLRITQSQAQDVADIVNNSISQGAVFSYEDQTWEAERSELASWVVTSIDAEGDEWVLTPYFEEDEARRSLLSVFESNIDDDFEITFTADDSGEITVGSNATGTIPLVSDAVDFMNKSFFTEEELTDVPSVELTSTDLPSELSLEDAKDLGLVVEVSTFTTQYSSGAEARVNNIHVAASLLNNSIIKANDGSWSFNDTAGEATVDKGYQDAGAIVGGEYSDAIGGGICQVATTVFNAVYVAGYPITERHNHSLRMDSYPDGRDAAIAYPYLDLVWENDSTSDVLLTMTYTDSSVTATLWGVDPGYEVTTEYGEWIEGEEYSVEYEDDDTLAEGTEYVETTGVNGSSITITRIVTDSSGEVLHEDVFSSTYQPRNKVIVRGTASS